MVVRHIGEKKLVMISQTRNKAADELGRFSNQPKKIIYNVFQIFLVAFCLST
jgi:hypothetical protein